jgi:hypothetical protein
MTKRGGEVRRSSETKGSNEGVGSHYLFFYIRKDIYIYILNKRSSRKEVKTGDCVNHFQRLFSGDKEAEPSGRN